VSNPRYLYFLLASASWFLSWGLQAVTLPWLLVEELRESPERVGLAQSLAQLPALPLLLLGGVAADRLDARRVLLVLHGALGLLFVALALLLAAGQLSYPRLLAFTLAAGAVNALQHPARDQQLNQVASEFIGRGVAGANLVGQVGQALGGLAGAVLAFLGAPVVLALQAGLGLAGVLPLAVLRAPPPSARPVTGHPVLAGLGDAVRVAVRSPVLGPVLLLTGAVGLLFVGPYGVVLPLLVRDVYGRGPQEIGLLVSMLPVGGIAGGLLLFRRGGVRRNGRAILVGQAFAALCVGSLALAPPLAGAALAVFGWGFGSAFFLSAGRTLFHVHAPDSQRATLLALYILGILGAGPLGSLLSGALVGSVGPHATLGLQAAAMLSCVALVAWRSGLASA
jgi:MFS family permease